jgi:hypothetical protein
MTSEETKSPGILKNLPVVEKILLCALALGAILAVLDINFTLLRASLIGLAAIFFLLAYRPPEKEIQREENEPGGFSELLALTIIPKVLWISSAVSLIGIAFYFISPENEGYKQMLFIGMTTLGTALIVLAFFLVSGTKHLKTVVPILYRAVPALIAAIYFLVK